MAPALPPQHDGFSSDVVDAIYNEMLGAETAPPSSRSQKNKSGDPDKRPRGRKNAKAMNQASAIATKAAEIARKPIKVRDADGEREITVMEAALMQLAKQAAAGNVPAIRLLSEKVAQFEAAEEKRKAAEAAEWARIRAQWEAYVARTRPLFEAAEASGRPPPDIYPHPNDLVFKDNGQLRIVGPICAQSAQGYAEIASTTDYWLTMIAYDWWRGQRGGPFSNRAEFTYVSEIQFWQQQAMLPPRMRLTETDVVIAIVDLQRLSGRKLHRRLSELGRKGNLYVPPWRAQLPPTAPTELWLEASRNGISDEDFLHMWATVLKRDAAERQARRR
jgi:hypothetical protein